MSQLYLRIQHTDRTEAYRLAGALTDLMSPPPDALSIFESADQGWQIDAYFDAAPPQGETAYANAVFDLSDVAPSPVTWAPVPDENWVALSQAALPPVETHRFVIHGSHDRDAIGRRRNAIEIDAGEAFGTAHHATTFGCLEALHFLAPKCAPASILDLGTGSGVLAIAAARIWPHAQIVASDLDRDAVTVAARNVRHNEAARAVRILAADGVPDKGRCANARFDLVIANILAGPLCRLAPSIRRAMPASGWLVLSGILNHQANAVIASYCANGFAVRRHIRLEGWSTLILQARPR